MATVNSNTVVTKPDGTAVSLLKGSEVPAWASKQVGGHLLDESEPTPYRSQKMRELKVELERRNADRPDDAKINPEGTASIESYAAALEADDKAQAESADGGGDAGDGAGSGDGASGGSGS